MRGVKPLEGWLLTTRIWDILSLVIHEYVGENVSEGFLFLSNCSFFHVNLPSEF